MVSHFIIAMYNKNYYQIKFCRIKTDNQGISAYFDYLIQSMD